MKLTAVETILDGEFSWRYNDDNMDDWGEDDFVVRHAHETAERFRSLPPDQIEQMKGLLDRLLHNPRDPLMKELVEGSLVTWDCDEEWPIFKGLMDEILRALEAPASVPRSAGAPGRGRE